MYFDGYSLSLIITAILALGVGFFSWRRTSKGRKTLAFLMLAIAAWSISQALEAAAARESVKVFWSQVSYFGIHSLPPLFLILAWQYNEQERWLSKKVVIVLWIIPVLTMVLAATNGMHHLIWTGCHWQPNNPRILIYEYGPGFWMGALYDYLLVLIASGTFLHASQHTAGLYRKQAHLIILAAVIPLLGNLLYITKMNPLTSRDLSPTFFLLSGSLLSFSMRRFKFLELAPIARSKIIETMTDAVIVVDKQHRIRDLNRAAESLIEPPAEKIIGQPMREALKRWPYLASRFHEMSKSPDSSEIIQDNEERWYKLRINPLLGEGKQSQGWLIILHDITEQRELESALREREQLYRNVTENANDGIVIVQAYSIKYCNPQMAAMVDHPIKDILDKTFVKFIAPEQVDLIRERYDHRLHGEALPSRYETALLHASGRHIPVEFNISVIEYQSKPAILAIVRDITSQKATERELQKYARQQKLLNDIARDTMEAAAIDESLQILADHLCNLTRADGCYITLWDQEKRKAVPTAACGSLQKHFKTTQPNADESTITEAVLSQERPLIIEDTHSTPHLNPESADPFPARSLLGLPLMGNGQKLGAVLLAFDKPHHFTQEDINLGEQASHQVALTVLKMHLVREAQERAMEMKTLREAGLAVTSTLDLNETIHHILEQLSRVVPYDSASVQLLEEDALVIVGGRSWADSKTLIGLRFPVPGDNPHSTVVQTREPQILNDARQAYETFKQKPHNHIRSWLGVPLFARDKVVGLLALDSVKKGYFTPDHAHLVSAFANQVAVAIENARLFEEIQRFATTDELTGVHNRRHLLSLGKREFERAHRYDHPLSAIMLDIDQFKQVNDTYGHTAGDQVLQKITKGCLEKLRDIDLVGRYGGEEFFILLPDTSLHKAMDVAERLRLCVEGTSFSAVQEEVSITLSLGVAERTEDCENLKTLIDRADAAMYLAKQRGKNQVAAWSDSIRVNQAKV